MIFLITLVLPYSMTKSVVIALIYFLVFLSDLFVMGLVLSGEDLIKIAKGHMRSTCRKLNSQARCLTQYSLSRQVIHDLDSRFASVVSDLQSSPVLLKMVTFCFPISHTNYTLITHKNCGEPIERKTLRDVFATHPPYERERESYSFLERNLCSLFSFPLPLLYPLRGDLYSNTTHTHSKC